MSAAWRVSASRPTRTPTARRPRRLRAAAHEGAGRRDRQAAPRRSRPPPTPTSCSPPTARCAGRARRSRKLAEGDDALKPAPHPARRRRADRPGARARAGAHRPLAGDPCRDAAEAALRSSRRRGSWRRRRAASPSASSRTSASSSGPRSPTRCKALDQDARAGLRALGVRFGAYHIYVPALLKPAPSGTARACCGR